LTEQLAHERKRFHAGLLYSSLKYGLNIVSALVYSILVSRTFGASLIGTFGLLMTFLGVFNIVSNLGEQGGLVKIVNQYNAKDHAVVPLVLLLLLTSFTLTLVLGVPFMLIAKHMFSTTYHNADLFWPFCLLTLSYLLFNNTASIFGNIYVAFQEMRYSLVIELVMSVFKISGVFVSLWFLGKSLMAMIALQIGIDILNLILCLAFLGNVITFGVRFSKAQWAQAWTDLKAVLVFGIKLVPKNYNYLITEYMDRILIPVFIHNIVMLGLYITAYQAFSKFLVFAGVFSRMLFPSLARMSMDTQLPEMLSLYRESIKKLLTLMAFVVGYGAGFATMIMGIFGPEFKGADLAFTLLLIGLLPEVLSMTSATLLQGFNRPGLVSIYFTVGTFLNLGLNLLLIPRLGITGAAVANTSGLTAFATLFYLNACRVAKQPILTRPHCTDYLKILLAAGLIYGLAVLLGPYTQGYLSFAVASFILLMLYAAMIHGLGVYNLSPVLKSLKERVSHG